MTKIQYIGKKPQRIDTVAGTGIVWAGNGDVQLVPSDAAKRMLQHPDIWAIAEDQEPSNEPAGEPTPTPSAEAEPAESGPQVAAISLPDGTIQALDGMSKEALHDLAKALGVRVHHLSGADKVTEALVAAFPVKV